MRFIFSSILLSSILGPASASLIRSAMGNPENDFTHYLPHARRLEATDATDVHPKDAALRGHRKLVTLHVGDPTMSGCSASYATINEALSSTSASDITIELCEGVFEESVVVEEPGLKLKILGQGQGLSTILAPSFNASAVVRAEPETEVVLEDLTLNGGNRLIAFPPETIPPRGPFVQGFYCDRCDAKLMRVEIINIVSANDGGPWADPTTPGFIPYEDFFSFGVQVTSEPDVDAGNKVQIKQSNISGSNRGAISVFGPVEVEIVENTITMNPNPDSARFPFQSDGIFTFDAVKAKIIKNTILNAVSGAPASPFPGIPPAPLPLSSAIAVDCPASGNEIKENILVDSDVGITLNTASNVKVEKNTISNVEGGINVETFVFPCGDEEVPIARNNEIKENTITNSTVAIGVRNSEPLDFGQDPANSIIEGNKIERNIIASSTMAAILVEFGQDETITDNQVVEPLQPVVPTEPPV